MTGKTIIAVALLVKRIILALMDTTWSEISDSLCLNLDRGGRHTPTLLNQALLNNCLECQWNFYLFIYFMAAEANDSSIAAHC